MIKKFTLLFLCLGCFFAAFSQKIKSPAEYLGYRLGTEFTPHYRIVEYLKYIATASKNVKLEQYGETNEGRPLLAMFVASDENINRLEDIRRNNLRLAGIENAVSGTTLNTPVIVWLSYNVHGNEPSSSEAAMQTLYDMVDPDNNRAKKWLQNTVVIIDPCLNPDGRDRYINFYNTVKDSPPNADPLSREHLEPWPGGRYNHYYFDLNRDWAWQTQKETQARIALFNAWLPQIHVDFHEQNYNSPYYFAPAAEPFHRDITSWQKEFQTIIGKNNAKYFDQKGWMYFTKEEFDLLYPSYGDTYPIYNGSIGMTYEQGGIGAGLTITTKAGDTLTLADRIAHHHSNSLSTIESASEYAQKAVKEFKKYFDDSRNNPPGEFKTYIIKNTSDDKIKTLAKLLDRNGIQYGFGLNQNVTGYSYFSDKTEKYTINPSDMVINAYQPKSVLLNVLFEPKTFIADSNTYDITAWALPYAYGLNAYGLKNSLKPSKSSLIDKPVELTSTNNNTYAYICNWQSVQDVKFLSAMLKKGIKVRYAEAPFEAGGRKFKAGSLIITKAGNNFSDFDHQLTQLARLYERNLMTLNSGFVDKGADIGSHFIKYIHSPKVIVITSDGVSAEAAGEVWHFFEKQIGYPVTLVRYQDFNRLKLSDYDVAIFPDGSYIDFPADKLQAWVHDGGKLIMMENAISQLIDKKGFSIKNILKPGKDSIGADIHQKKDNIKNKLATVKLYANRNREAIKSNVPGAIYKINLDNTHPLGFGLDTYYYTLKLNDGIYNYLGDDGWNVGTVKKDGYVEGFVGQKSKEKITNGLLLGVQSLGHGSVIYMVDNPLFRSFWENGKLLFSNAVFMVGQ